MIRANFTAYGRYVTDSVNQWDLNHTLRVSGLNLTSAPEVHFSNANVDRAIVRQSTMTDHVVEVSIPNSLLQDPLTIKAHIGVYEGGTFKVVELVEIPVKPRKRPADYQIEDTDEEVYSFKRLENALANKADSAATAQADAALNARINNIVANANKTDGNSELVDLRTDAFGSVGASAGAIARKWQTKVAQSHTTGVGFLYSGFGGHVQFEPLTGGALQVTFPNSLTLIAPDNNGVSIPWESSCSDVASYITISGDGSAVLAMPYRTCFVYNVTDKRYHIRPVSYVTQGDIIAINNIYQSPVSGSIVDEHLWKSSETFKNYIAAQNAPATIPNKVKTFAGLFKDAGVVESFLFFTDQHKKQGDDWADNIATHLEEVKAVYDAAPVSFCVSGGDWLNDSDTRDEACTALAYIDSQMRAKFDKYYMVVGNHDTNYQGIDGEGGASYSGRLSNEALANLWGRSTGKMYYNFEGQNTTFFVFDTGIDWNATLDSYSLEQAKWYADSLKTFQGEHIAIATHMLHVSSTADYSPLVEKVCEISEAYNTRASVTISGTVYNFSDATGRVEFMFAGHSHADLTGTLHGVPYFITTMSAAGYDLVLVDYTAREIKLTRIGQGEDRVLII